MKLKYLFALLFLFLVAPNVEAATFKDVPKSNYFYNDIQELNRFGIINGYPDGTFRPNDYITNRQTAIMLTRYLETANMEFDSSFMNYFIDIPSNDYALREISSSLYLGLIPYYVTNSWEFSIDTGNSELKASGLKFFPNQYTNRANMAKAIVKALGITGDEKIYFKDQKDVAFSEEEIGILASNSIVNGIGDGLYGAKRPITRAEFSKILNRSIQLLEKEALQKQAFTLNQPMNPLKPYTENVKEFAYGNGRYAAILNKNWQMRYLDMHTLKTTIVQHQPSLMAMHKDLLAFKEDKEAKFIDLTTKIRQPITFIENEEDLRFISFSNDGRFIFAQTFSLSNKPHYIYDRVTGKTNRLSVSNVDTQVQWKDNIAYIKTSDFGGVSILAYDPVQNQIIHTNEDFYFHFNEFQFYKEQLLFSNYTFIGLVDPQTGDVDKLVTFPNNTTGNERFTFATDGTNLYHIVGQTIQQRNIASGENKTIYTLTSPYDTTNAKLSVHGSFLAIYGDDLVFTLIKIK